MRKRKPKPEPVIHWNVNESTGTLSAKVCNLVPIIAEQADGTFRFTLKVDHSFDDKDVAEAYATEVIASLQDDGLSCPEEDWQEQPTMA